MHAASNISIYCLQSVASVRFFICICRLHFIKRNLVFIFIFPCFESNVIKLWDVNVFGNRLKYKQVVMLLLLFELMQMLSLIHSFSISFMFMHIYYHNYNYVRVFAEQVCLWQRVNCKKNKTFAKFKHICSKAAMCLWRSSHWEHSSQQHIYRRLILCKI